MSFQADIVKPSPSSCGSGQLHYDLATTPSAGSRLAYNLARIGTKRETAGQSSNRSVAPANAIHSACSDGDLQPTQIGTGGPDEGDTLKAHQAAGHPPRSPTDPALHDQPACVWSASPRSLSTAGSSDFARGQYCHARSLFISALIRQTDCEGLREQRSLVGCGM